MTPQDHLARAELLLAKAESAYDNEDTIKAISLAEMTIAHGLIALAAESGVPHAGPQQGSDTGG